MNVLVICSSRGLGHGYDKCKITHYFQVSIYKHIDQVKVASILLLSGISAQIKGKTLNRAEQCMHVEYGTGHWVEESGQNFSFDWLATPSAPIISLHSFL